jgi:hypothetical protein
MQHFGASIACAQMVNLEKRRCGIHVQCSVPK